MAKPTAKDQNEEQPEQYEVLDVLRDSFYSVGNRTKRDRYREFRNVFMATDEGKRVLYEILRMARLSADLVDSYPSPVDEKRILVWEGRRNLANDILKVLHREPVEEKPTQTTNRPRR